MYKAAKEHLYAIHPNKIKKTTAYLPLSFLLFFIDLIDENSRYHEHPHSPVKAVQNLKNALLAYGLALFLPPVSSRFSRACKSNIENFYITHGDAGGNCILSENHFFITDWDSVKYVPIVRDAWIFMCDNQQLEKINAVLAKSNIHYTLKQERLCYYCYYSFFYYLNEYLKSILSTQNEEQKQLTVEFSLNT